MRPRRRPQSRRPDKRAVAERATAPRRGRSLCGQLVSNADRKEKRRTPRGVWRHGAGGGAHRGSPRARVAQQFDRRVRRIPTRGAMRRVGSDIMGKGNALAKKSKGTGVNSMQAVTLVDALKRILKGKGTTYAGVAQGLGLSEASVKRMFSRRDFTLQRLEEVCRQAGVDFADLARGDPGTCGHRPPHRESGGGNRIQSDAAARRALCSRRLDRRADHGDVQPYRDGGPRCFAENASPQPLPHGRSARTIARDKARITKRLSARSDRATPPPAT